MVRTGDKRERLIEAAKSLIHRQGFHRTTLAAIAEESGVPLGNVYYYFKTKEEICEAVIGERKKELTRKLELCCKHSDPRSALKKLVQYTSRESKELNECGCPYTGLCLDLDRTQSTLVHSADECVRVLTEWASDQFRALGCTDAKERGFEFIARVQGTILLGHVLHDPECIRRHMTSLCDWIDTLPETALGKAAAG